MAMKERRMHPAPRAKEDCPICRLGGGAQFRTFELEELVLGTFALGVALGRFVKDMKLGDDDASLASAFCAAHFLRFDAVYVDVAKAVSDGYVTGYGATKQ